MDNAIHSAAGVQLRLECHRLMQEQGSEELTNSAKMTKGYNLPARYVIHTVGPIIQAPRPTPVQEQELANCYRSCLKIAPYVVAVWR
ncbi:macro domain-containing protein [Tannerella forsythia]|uniref:macro domain-containing protein n=1 Tax=Tannerella forsythia TaxID=28112 RepID=UPI0009C18869